MKAIILAAGRGSRLDHLTKHQPKCFTVFHGKRLIDWQLLALNQANIQHISIVTGYQSHAFYNSKFPVDIEKYFHNEQWSSSNMVRSLISAQAWLQNKTCVISYSDIVYSSQAVHSLMSTSADIAISYDPNWLKLWQMRFKQPLDDAETFQIEGQKLITIGARAQSIEEIQGQYMGLLKVTPKGWHIIDDHLQSLNQNQIDQLDMTALLSQLLTKGVTIKVSAIDDEWYEVDSLADVLKYQSLEKSQLPLL